MSQLTTLILKSFIPPFIITFFIAWFVFLMQFLWFFMEKISGKGLSFGLVMELIGYRSVALFPVVLPLAALVAGLMVVGGLAEHYELAAIHSAGKGLGRVLIPLAAMGLLLVGASYTTADYLIPAANVQFLQRLGDVQRKKPDLSIETGVFNEDLANFNVYAASRDPKNGDLRGVRIYDQSGYESDPRINQIIAARGTFHQNNSGAELILTLHDGHHLREKTSRTVGGQFTRTEFKTYQLSFDLSQFNLKEVTDLTESDHYALLPSWELKRAADSIQEARQLKRAELAETTLILPANSNVTPNESSSSIDNKAASVPPKKPTISFKQLPASKRKSLLQTSRNKVRSIQQHARTVIRYDQQEQGHYERYRFERHSKFGLAAICLVFVLIGGATGAVIRKGGFGYPLLIGIGCFMAYIMVMEFCQRLMKTNVLTGPVAAWIPVLLLSLSAIFLYFRAARR